MRGLQLILCLFTLSANAEVAANIAGARAGYLASIAQEREQRDVEMVLVPAPVKNEQDTVLGRPLVDSKLTKEFQAQYELKFGNTDAERIYNNSNRFAFFEYPGGKQENLEIHERRQQQFGNYMFRRLTEHHVDQYAKSNPDIRPVYELKDKISNVNVTVRPGYKLKLNYSYSGNYLDVRLQNPYDIATKITYQFGSGVGPSNIERTIYSASYPLTKVTTISAFQEVDVKSSTSLVAAQRLNKTLSATFTASRGVPVDRDIWQTSPRQNLVLLGFSWTE